MFKRPAALRELAIGYLQNLKSPPPWPRKLVVIVLNRSRAARSGCCGNHGQPGC